MQAHIPPECLHTTAASGDGAPPQGLNPLPSSRVDGFDGDLRTAPRQVLRAYLLPEIGVV